MRGRFNFKIFCEILFHIVTLLLIFLSGIVLINDQENIICRVCMLFDQNI